MGKLIGLCTGINDYPGTGADLRGCVNDALDWSTLLVRQGYETTTLLNDQVTKAAVVDALKTMVGRARFSDRIVWPHSGHGSWVVDRDGDEVDGRDECLVLHDYANGGLLTDDEIHSIFQERRYGVRVLIIPDTCHSGTAQRFMGNPSAAEDAMARFLTPDHFLDGQELKDATRVQDAPMRGLSRPTTALLSGCAEAEYSYDAYIGGRFRGAFTASAVETYDPEQSLVAWHRRIREHLDFGRYPQTPQLGATSSQRRWKL